jgi:hypothetical protein
MIDLICIVMGEYNGPRNLDSQTGKNKVQTSHAQTLQCDLQG